MGAAGATAAAGLGGQLLGTGLSIFGQLDQAGETARTAETNALLADEEAQQVRDATRTQVSDVTREGQDVSSAARTVAASANVAGGSLEDIFALSEANAAVDASRLQQQGNTREVALMTQASQSRRKADAARKAGILGSLGTGIQGAGGAASSVIGAI